ncbi:MAG: GMC family oxidoreductase [Saprospiraceae bacterium]|nr:GMC family oxidoreductase [Saprospiraceae bacterium]
MKKKILQSKKSVDVLVIGSGFGGAVTACRLAQAGRSVIILERGKDYQNKEKAIEAEGPVYDSDTKTSRYGHFQIDHGTGMNVIRGIGVGGGSLHYFGVRLRAPETIFKGPLWPKEITRKVMDPYYDIAGTMLEASPLKPSPVLGIPKRSKAFLDGAGNCSRCLKKTLEFVPIAINTSSKSITSPSGIKQHPCVFCGACLLGCPQSETYNGNVNARAKLTLNYLAVAQEKGAKIFAEHNVTHIEKQVNGKGFKVYFQQSKSDTSAKKNSFIRAKQVVLGAGTLGSTEILLKSAEALPGLNVRMLGKNFSGNGDLLASGYDMPFDLEPTSGPTITVGGRFKKKGSDNEIYIEDLGSIPFAAGVLGLDENTPKTSSSNRHRIGYLGMGTDAGNGILKLKGKINHFKRIHLDWDPKESLPLYNEIIDSMKEISQQLGGNFQYPQGYDPETGTGLMTAHPLGGCVMADNPKKGVVNPQGEVFGVPGLFVADGAIVPSALVVNPSYTITALAERVAHWMIHNKELS